MPVLPAFAPQERRSCKNWGFPLQKKFLRMDQGIEITGRDRETERISVQYFFKSMRYRFTLVKRISHSIWRSYIMIRLSVLVSVLVSPVLFLPRVPLQEDSSDVSCCRYRYHGVAYLSLNFRILQHQAFIKPPQGP